MTVAAIAEHVDHDRLVEFLPVIDRDLGGEHHRLLIAAVDVENRRTISLATSDGQGDEREKRG